MSINPQGSLLITAGEDSNIFLFRINPDSHSNFLVPIGFYPTSDMVTYITWHPTIVINHLKHFSIFDLN